MVDYHGIARFLKQSSQFIGYFTYFSSARSQNGTHNFLSVAIRLLEFDADQKPIEFFHSVQLAATKNLYDPQVLLTNLDPNKIKMNILYTLMWTSETHNLSLQLSTQLR